MRATVKMACEKLSSVSRNLFLQSADQQLLASLAAHRCQRARAVMPRLLLAVAGFAEQLPRSLRSLFVTSDPRQPLLSRRRPRLGLTSGLTVVMSADSRQLMSEPCIMVCRRPRLVSARRRQIHAMNCLHCDRDRPVRPRRGAVKPGVRDLGTFSLRPFTLI